MYELWLHARSRTGSNPKVSFVNGVRRTTSDWKFYFLAEKLSSFRLFGDFSSLTEASDYESDPRTLPCHIKYKVAIFSPTMIAHLLIIIGRKTIMFHHDHHHVREGVIHYHDFVKLWGGLTP